MEGGIAYCDAAWPPQAVAKFTHRRNKLSISSLYSGIVGPIPLEPG